MSPTIDLRVVYTGKVQGMGFRYAVKQIATGYEIVGGVRNLLDGRVELCASGDAKEVEAFLKAITASQLRTFIQQVERMENSLPANAKSGFEIWR